MERFAGEANLSQIVIMVNGSSLRLSCNVFRNETVLRVEFAGSDIERSEARIEQRAEKKI